MNIVILSDGTSIIGGADKVAILSAVGLAKRGHRVRVISALGPIDPSLNDVPNLTVTCTHQEGLGGLEFHRTRFWNQKSRAALLEILPELPVGDSIIHSHCYYGMLSSSVIDAALSSSHPTIITMHDYGIACPQRNFFHYGENRICTRKPLSASCLFTNCTTGSIKSKLPMIGVSLAQKYRSNVAKRLENAAFVSEFSERVLSEFLSETTRRFQIQNPVDTAKVPRAQAENHTEFLFIGRMVGEKAPLDLARAARLAGAKAVFIGDGPQRDAVMRENPDAECTGWLDSAAVHQRIASARALVVSSVWYETGCPILSMSEAQAHGLPCIVADTNASRDAICDGETGLLYRGGDVEHLRSSIEALLDDPTASRMSIATYERYWSAPPSLDAHLDRLEQVYGEILASRFG